MKANDQSLPYQMYGLDELNGTDYIEIQLGKQKKKHFKDTSVYFNKHDFAIFEPTIFRYYREYRPFTNVRIESGEWRKIIKGFKVLEGIIDDADNLTVIGEKLGFEDNIEQYLKDYGTLNIAIKQSFLEFTKWLESHLDDVHHITISGNA